MASNELMLLERVFLRLGSTETDEQLESILSKFLAPVLLKLSSEDGQVRKKVMELLMHVNKRVKSRPLVQLPVEVLLAQYQDPTSTPFVINFTIIYVKTGFPRLPVEKQVELISVILNSLKDKPQSHVDDLLLLILPLLGKVKLPTIPDQIPKIYDLHEKLEIRKQLLAVLLDTLLLPYGTQSIQPQPSLVMTGVIQPNPEEPRNDLVELSTPPSLSSYSYKKLISNEQMIGDKLEEVKMGIVKFISGGVFKDEEILIHLIVGSADTRFGISNIAQTGLKKILGVVDWSSVQVCLPMYTLFLGSQNKNIKPHLKKSAACTRIRLKLLTYLCRTRGNGIVFPACIQIVFDSLYGVNTNSRLKTLALNFTANIIRDSDKNDLEKVAKVLLGGLQKLLSEGEECHQGQSYILIGMLGQKFPKLVFDDISLLELFFKNLENSNADLKLQIREGFLSLILAYHYNNFPNNVDENGRLNIIFALIKYRMKSEDSIVRFVTVRILASVFPRTFIASKLLLLQATADIDDVSSEAFKSLYGSSRKSDVDLGYENVIPSGYLPPFGDTIDYVYQQLHTKDEDSPVTKEGNNVLSLPVAILIEVLMYTRLCLLQDLKIPLTREVMKHPCEYTPVLGKHLQKLYETELGKQQLSKCVNLGQYVILSNAGVESLCFLIEIIGCVPQLSSILFENLLWLRNLVLSSTKDVVRQYSAMLYGILLSEVDIKTFESAMNHLIDQIDSKNPETQHGSLLALGSCLQFRLSNKGITDNLKKLISTVLHRLDGFLKHQNAIMVEAACISIGLLGQEIPLPLETGEPEKVGSPSPKRPANDNVTKYHIVDHLLSVINNKTLPIKIKEKAVTSLGLLCIGERFPHTKMVIDGLLSSTKEIKDVQVHFTVGESLVMCIQGILSPEARNKWTTLADQYKPETVDSVSNEYLVWLLDELLTNVTTASPISQQAHCIWLVAIVKSCGEMVPITERVNRLQNCFMTLLCENNEIVQDVAAKGLCILYDIYKTEELLVTLMKQLSSGSRQVNQVTSDTKVFEEGQLGAAPTGGNLSTYKELCSLASDLNKPDLIYKFMHLAKHNSIWNSKKGAAFGFSSIAEKCKEDLKSYLPDIVPKLYRYQYDPTPSIQLSMHNLWKVLVDEPQKIVSQYYFEILADLLENLNSNQYRVRQSCCLALQDLMKGYGTKSIHDCLDYMDELWTKLFRVMDDHHEGTRMVAIGTAQTLNKLCLNGCDESQGKSAVKMIEAFLPPLLQNGITNSAVEVRLLSLQTVTKLVGSAGKQLKSFLPIIIPSLLRSQEAFDNAGLTFSKSSFTNETVTKCLQHVDGPILQELMPKIIELMRASVSVGIRTACTSCITLLVLQMGQEMQPYSGKLLSILSNGLLDRNSTIRKNYATTIGYVVSTAKETNLEKLFAKLQKWYFERDGDEMKSALGYTLQSVGNHNQDIFKEYSEILLPLVFFAMHAEKTSENDEIVNLWNEIWCEHSPGTELGIRQNINNICDMIKTALESPSWVLKAQAATAITTVSNKLGADMDIKHQNMLVQILLNGLASRTWNGKDKLLTALSSVCSNCKDTLKESREVNTTEIVERVLKECQREDVVYKTSALRCLSNVISCFEIDRFDEIYELVQNILTSNKSDSKEDEPFQTRENAINLKAVAYETLGKTWPRNRKSTQEKYQETLVEHCVQNLTVATRSVQVTILEALYNFTEKLCLLDNKELTEKESEILTKINDHIISALEYSLGISKHSKLIKESLNIILCLSTKLKACGQIVEFDKLRKMVELHLSKIEANSPEIKTRIKDVNTLYNSSS